MVLSFTFKIYSYSAYERMNVRVKLKISSKGVAT